MNSGVLCCFPSPKWQYVQHIFLFTWGALVLVRGGQVKAWWWLAIDKQTGLSSVKERWGSSQLLLIVGVCFVFQPACVLGPSYLVFHAFKAFFLHSKPTSICLLFISTAFSSCCFYCKEYLLSSISLYIHLLTHIIWSHGSVLFNEFFVLLPMGILKTLIHIFVQWELLHSGSWVLLMCS